MKNNAILTFIVVLIGLDFLCMYVGQFLVFPYVLAAVLNVQYLNLFVPIFGRNALYNGVDYGVTIYPLGWILIVGLFFLVGAVVYTIEKIRNKPKIA